MRVRYEMTRISLSDEDGTPHRVYGVAAIDGSGRQIGGIEDVFVCEREAKEFVRLCNRKKLAPEHLEECLADAVEQAAQ
ncbi:MAG: hypothetical protein KIG36_03400 [Eubacteriales bacterium]|nr:hypothetical protein [Eubacteriales bacterium]